MNWKLLTVLLCLPLITSSTENTPMNILSQRVAGLTTELVRINGLYLSETVESTSLVEDVTRLEGAITRLTSDLGIRRSPRLVAKLRESITSLSTLKNLFQSCNTRMLCNGRIANSINRVFELFRYSEEITGILVLQDDVHILVATLTDLRERVRNRSISRDALDAELMQLQEKFSTVAANANRRGHDELARPLLSVRTNVHSTEVRLGACGHALSSCEERIIHLLNISINNMSNATNAAATAVAFY